MGSTYCAVAAPMSPSSFLCAEAASPMARVKSPSMPSSTAPGHLEPKSDTEDLPVLGKHPVAVQVAVGGEVADDLEGVLGVLQGPRGSLAAVGPVAKQGFEHGLGVRFLHF